MAKSIPRIISLVAIFVPLIALALLVGNGHGQATAIGWIPLLCAVFIILLDGAYVLLAKKSLAFELKGSASECMRGESLFVKVAFRNRLPMVIQGIKATFFMKSGSDVIIKQSTALLSLGPLSKKEVSVPMTFDNVGVFQIGIGQVRISDMFGLFSVKLEGTKVDAVKVMPRLFKLESIALSENALLESKQAVKSVLADSQDYAYVRDYVIGDPLKSIHWKLSARTGTYFTRLYEMSTNPGLVVVLDFYVPGEDGVQARQLLDIVVETGVSIAFWAAQHGLDIELCYSDKLGEVVSHQRYDSSLQDTLVENLPEDPTDSSIRPACTNMIRQMINGKSGRNNVVVCSANFEEDRISSVEMIQMDRRKAIFLGAVPSQLVDRALDEYCRHLHRFDNSSIRYVTLTDASELSGMNIQ